MSKGKRARSRPELRGRDRRMLGYRKLREGKIHLRCYACGRKTSNAWRDTENDPPDAVLTEVVCGNCDMGGKDPDQYWYDAEGKEIDWETSAAPAAVQLKRRAT